MAKQGLPAKYAKFGFKKGWAMYKHSRGGGKKHHSPHKKKSHSVHGGHGHTNMPALYASLMGPSSPTRRKGFMQVSKTNLQALKDKVSRAMKRARESKDVHPLEMGIGLAEGVGAGVGSSWLVGVLPMPKSLPRPGAWKAGAQTLAGGGLMFIPNKHARFAGFGVTFMGLLGLWREFFRFPHFAGEVDESIYGNAFEQAGNPDPNDAATRTVQGDGFDPKKAGAGVSGGGNAFEAAGNAFEAMGASRSDKTFVLQ